MAVEPDHAAPVAVQARAQAATPPSPRGFDAPQSMNSPSVSVGLLRAWVSRIVTLSSWPVIGNGAPSWAGSTWVPVSQPVSKAWARE